MLGISIRADLSVLAELMMKMNGRQFPATVPHGISSLPLDGRLSEAIVRLLEHLADPKEAEVLGPQTVREILYRVLCGEHGLSLLEALTVYTHFGRVSNIIQFININFAQSLDIKILANKVNMSCFVFHRRFKEITSMQPLQYIKTVRLHKARMLMVREGFRAGAAAEQVGYESRSQFSREFRRLFGRSPVEEAARVTQMLTTLRPILPYVE